MLDALELLNCLSHKRVVVLAFLGPRALKLKGFLTNFEIQCFLIRLPTDSDSKYLFDWISLGGAAAGYFGAITYAQNEQGRILILEATSKTLSKVRISGGGRCNVTHSCFDAHQLDQNYPRGFRELLSVFSRFQPLDTIEWFRRRDVHLKTEADGRIFPITDSSKTIIDSFEDARKELGIELKPNCRAQSIYKKSSFIEIDCGKKKYLTRNLLVATGSNKSVFDMIKKLGHRIVDPVPSLFSFNICYRRLKGLAGRSFKKVSISGKILKKKISSTRLTHHSLGTKRSWNFETLQSVCQRAF